MIDFVKFVDNFLDNLTTKKLITAIMIIISNIRSTHFKSEINEKKNKTTDILTQISEHKYYRKLLIFLSFYMYSKDLMFSVIFTMLFLIINELF